jgi:hypothetical protein
MENSMERVNLKLLATLTLGNLLTDLNVEQEPSLKRMVIVMKGNGEVDKNTASELTFSRTVEGLRFNSLMAKCMELALTTPLRMTWANRFNTKTGNTFALLADLN